MTTTDPTELCPWNVGDILACIAPTNFHEIGEVVVIEGLDLRYRGDRRPYWVRLYGKPGHYGWQSFRKATVEEIGGALRPRNALGGQP